MKKSRIALLGMVMAVTACGQLEAEPIDSAEQNALVGVADPTDPYTCQMKDGYDAIAEEFTPAMECTTTGGECFLSGPTPCTGDMPCGGGYSNADGGWYSSQYAVCSHACDVDADCPMPSSGTTTPTCFRWKDTPAGSPGSCVLPCGGGQACPNGFYCFQPGLMSCGSDPDCVDGEWHPMACFAFDEAWGPTSG